MTVMFFLLTTSVVVAAIFPRLWLGLANAQAIQNGHNVTCDCDCSIFQSTKSCSAQRMTTRKDCPCCQTCSRQAGELCDDIAFPCDEEFGLYCNQRTDTCEGSYGLRASEVIFNSIQLGWYRPQDFGQANLYIFYTPKYTTDLRRWIMQETAKEADSARLQGLQADTFYFAALVPEVDGMFHFENRSEIFAKKTEGCLHKNQSYATGETFSDGCAYNCTCTPEGLLACIERRCPLIYKKGEIKDPLCTEHDDPNSPDPCCVVYTCQNGQPTRDTHCVYKGKHYDLAQEFYDDDCSSVCYCDEIGAVNCRPLKCPQPSIPLHHNGSCLEWDVKQHATRSPPNCCPSYACVNDGSCESNGTKFRNGAEIPSSCDQHCVCDGGNIVCSSTCPEVSLSPPSDPHCPHFALDRDPSGCCEEWRCVTGFSADECILADGTRYPVGERWTERKNCRQLNCTCWRNEDGVAEELCGGGCPDISATALRPTEECRRPFVETPEDPCQCPLVRCKEMKNDALAAGHHGPEAPWYIFDATMVNGTSAQLVLNISDALLRDYRLLRSGAVLETHIARIIATNEPKNVSDIWQVSTTTLDHLLPTLMEYITGFQDNSIYKVKARLTLLDSALGRDVMLPLTPTLLLTVPARAPVCRAGNLTYEEGAVVPQGCGQDCTCQAGSIVCHPAQCTMQDSVLVASEFCPIPVLVKGAKDCCPRWECHPSATGCKLGNAIYSHGDLWRNGCSEECSCRNGIISCRDMCLDQKKAQPHPSCKAISITGSCCPVWSCHEGAALPVVDYAHGMDNSAMNLTVDLLTSTRARISWHRPTELHRIFGFNLYIEETVMDRESYREAKLIHPEVHEHVVHDLAPGTLYTATLKAVEDGDRVVASQSVQFQTLDVADVMLTVWLAYIGSEKAEAVWECQHCDELKGLKLTLLSTSGPGPAVGDVTPGLPKITLTSLSPKENYQLWLEGTTTSGLAVKSNVVAFTTRAAAEFNEIAREFQNSTERFGQPAIFALDTEQQKLSTALIIVSVLGTFFLVAFLLALGLCCYYRKNLLLQKASSYQTYTTDTMYR